MKKKVGIRDKEFDHDYRGFVYPLSDFALVAGEAKTILKYKIKLGKAEAEKFYKEIKKIKYSYDFDDLYGNNFRGTKVYA